MNYYLAKGSRFSAAALRRIKAESKVLSQSLRLLYHHRFPKDSAARGKTDSRAQSQFILNAEHTFLNFVDCYKPHLGIFLHFFLPPFFFVFWYSYLSD